MIKKLIISDTQFSTPQIFNDVAATTLEELKREIPSINFKGKSIVERDSRASLELEDAKLPNQDTVVLFLSTKNVKAGLESEDLSREELIKFIQDELDNNGSYYVLQDFADWATEDLRDEVHSILTGREEDEEASAAKTILIEKLDSIISSAQYVRDNIDTISGDSFMESIIEETAEIQAALANK